MPLWTNCAAFFPKLITVRKSALQWQEASVQPRSTPCLARSLSQTRSPAQHNNPSLTHPAKGNYLNTTTECTFPKGIKTPSFAQKASNKAVACCYFTLEGL